MELMVRCGSDFDNEFLVVIETFAHLHDVWWSKAMKAIYDVIQRTC